METKEIGEPIEGEFAENRPNNRDCVGASSLAHLKLSYMLFLLF